MRRAYVPHYWSPLARLRYRTVDFDKPGVCWLWSGTIRPDGYGIIHLRINGQRRLWLVHRLAYELLVGPIPDALVLDHRCGRHACCNPEHLEPVTLMENSRRSNRHFLDCPPPPTVTPQPTLWDPPFDI